MSSRLQLDVRNLSLGMRHLVNAYEVEAGKVKSKVKYVDLYSTTSNALPFTVSRR